MNDKHETYKHTKFENDNQVYEIHQTECDIIILTCY